MNSSIRNNSGIIYELQISKDTNKYVNLLDDEKILHSVIFINDRNWIRLNDNTLTLDSNYDKGF